MVNINPRTMAPHWSLTMLHLTIFDAHGAQREALIPTAALAQFRAALEPGETLRAVPFRPTFRSPETAHTTPAIDGAKAA